MSEGTLYALTDFFDRLTPKSGAADGAYLKAVMGGVKRLADVQNRNPWVTLSATVTAGIWVHYRSRSRWLINPAQRYLRVETGFPGVELEPNIEVALRPAIEQGEVTDTGKIEFKQWRVSQSALPLVWEFFEGLDAPAEEPVEVARSHPRYFPGEVREMALEEFEREGRRCPGAKGRKPHTLTAADPIEFDHVIPWSRGGSSSYGNLQILCAACNRLKSDTAA